MAGWRISATCRSEDKRESLAAKGIQAWLFDPTRPLADSTTALSGVTHLLSSVPPDETGDPVLDRHAAD